MIVNGFPGAALTRLVDHVALLKGPRLLELAIGVSRRTLQRRKGASDERPLSAEQSGRAWTFATIPGRDRTFRLPA